MNTLKALSISIVGGIAVAMIAYGFFYPVSIPEEIKEPCTTIVVGAPLHTQGNFIHFEGTTLGESRLWSKVSPFLFSRGSAGIVDIRFPEEIRDGYLTMIEEGVDKSTYLLWTENKAFEYPGQKIKFWGFTDNINPSEDMPILYPMVKSK